MIYLGIDISTARKPITYIAYNQSLELMALGNGSSEDILSYAAGQSAAYIGINAPLQPNQGLMQQRAVRQSLFPEITPGRWTKLRVAEYELHQAGIRIPFTPSTRGEGPSWMRLGYDLYKQLQKLGYQIFPKEDAERLLLESQADAAFWQLIEKNNLFEAKTLEGRMQRQLILHELNLPVSNPMNILEEITRYKMMRGIFPNTEIHTPQELNALVIAYTAWLAHNQPDVILQFGKPEEGQVTLPPKLEDLLSQNRK